MRFARERRQEHQRRLGSFEGMMSRFFELVLTFFKIGSSKTIFLLQHRYVLSKLACLRQNDCLSTRSASSGIGSSTIITPSGENDTQPDAPGQWFAGRAAQTSILFRLLGSGYETGIRLAVMPVKGYLRKPAWKPVVADCG